MNRRHLLKFLSLGAVTGISSQLVWREFGPQTISSIFEDTSIKGHELAQVIQYMTTAAPVRDDYLRAWQTKEHLQDDNEQQVKQYYEKMKSFARDHHEDLYLPQNKYQVLSSTFKRLDRVQNLVGYANFNVLSLDQMLRFSYNYPSISAFTAVELDFLEELFSQNSRQYGFYGNKVITELTATINVKDSTKIPRTGHYLFRGQALEIYDKLRRDVGNSIILTSGIRSVVKQIYLFFAKAIQAKGNLSLASRSLAPPGYSFHGIGDFDVGKVGLGIKNFTTEFTKTQEFKRLVELGYVDMRYPKDNLLGVRYEPWHIKVA